MYEAVPRRPTCADLVQREDSTAPFQRREIGLSSDIVGAGHDTHSPRFIGTVARCTGPVRRRGWDGVAGERDGSPSGAVGVVYT